ncbi:hypothetical protein SHIRM173S_07736 [Streptomyces hirsutus]
MGVGDWVTDHWDEIVVVCKWVVADPGVVGDDRRRPAGLAGLRSRPRRDGRYVESHERRGRLGRPPLGGPGLQPATKGFTSLAKLGKLWKAGGLKALGAGAMGGIGGGLKNLDGVPLYATVTVSVLGARNKQGVTPSTDPRAIAESLGTITPRREGDAWRKVTTVDIPEVGTAARTYGVEDVPVAQGDSRTLRMVLTQTYIPVPGTADQVVLVSGASPVLDLAEAFHDIFDAVTSTFRFV